MPMYKVMVDDNFHYMDEDERYEHAAYSTAEEALVACRKLVDDCLVHHYRPGMTAGELYGQYTMFGDDPFIVAPPGIAAVDFSAWTYARERARAMCGGEIK